jgi:hypothetical protein
MLDKIMTTKKKFDRKLAIFGHWGHFGAKLCSFWQKTTVLTPFWRSEQKIEYTIESATLKLPRTNSLPKIVVWTLGPLYHHLCLGASKVTVQAVSGDPRGQSHKSVCQWHQWDILG